MFSLHEKIILYDLTNTYFEDNAKGNKKVEAALFKCEKENVLYCKSSSRLKKETSIRSRYQERFSGLYFLRTSRLDLGEQEIWSLYAMLTRVEAIAHKVLRI